MASPTLLILVLFCLVLAHSHATQLPHSTHRFIPRSSSPSTPPPPSLHSPATASVNGTWTVDVGSAVHPLSVDMWGIFYEEIGYSGQGGIHQQQIANGNFETTTADYAPWQTLPAPAAVQYVVRLGQELPINAYNPTSMAVEARVNGGVDDGDASVEVGVMNPGYWGISLVGRAAFNLSLFVMSPTVTALTARLQSNDTVTSQTTYAEATISVSPSWSKQSAILQLGNNSADDSAVLTLTWTTTAPSTTVYLDVVSLLPSTGYHSVPWLRPDLGRLVAELKPSIVRLPGGCYVEGGRLSNRFNWKRAVGDSEERRGHLNDVWGYYVEDQLGIFEYLTWAESLRDVYGQPTRVVWVVNSGTAHTDSIPVDHISGWVQDALDSVDFIRGSSSETVWGGRRAAMGRSEPFHSLKYVAIGNEDCGKPYYEANYRVFYAALQAAHPDLILVGNCEPSQMNATEAVWDYHVYPSYDWFIANERQWDDYPRSGPLVYVSEYATHGGQGKGNLRAALAEAVYMLGLERNADLITAAAYAPLLTNVEGRPDNIQQAVLFNHRASYGTPSYWTQWMFARAVEGATPGSVYTLNHTLQAGASGQLRNVSVGALVGSVNATTSLVILKLVNYNLAQPASLAIQLAGLPASSTVQSAVEVRTLASESELDENSFDAPLHVSVVEAVSGVGASSFVYSVAANSLTVLRLLVSTQQTVELKVE